MREQGFARLGCFAYSQEEGTKAAGMPQMPMEVREQRAEAVMRIQTDIMAARRPRWWARRHRCCATDGTRKTACGCAAHVQTRRTSTPWCVWRAMLRLRRVNFYTVRIIDSDIYDLYATLAE